MTGNSQFCLLMYNYYLPVCLFLNIFLWSTGKLKTCRLKYNQYKSIPVFFFWGGGVSVVYVLCHDHLTNLQICLKIDV